MRYEVDWMVTMGRVSEMGTEVIDANGTTDARLQVQKLLARRFKGITEFNLYIKQTSYGEIKRYK